jgi:hypothetical protein
LSQERSSQRVVRPQSLSRKTRQARTQVQAWFPGYIASVFPIVFTQTNPITFDQAAGVVPNTVGSLGAFGRRYRFEDQTGTTLAQFAAALSDPAFGR